LCNDYPNCPEGSDESEEACKGKVEIKVDYSLPKGYSRDISPKIAVWHFTYPSGHSVSVI
jgi:hypothetical protein